MQVCHKPSICKKRKKATTKITLPSKDLIQIQWRNENLYRQAKVKRIQHHKTSFTTNVKVTALGKKLKEEENKKKYKNNQKTSNKMAINTYLSIITLNVNQLNAPIKRHRVAEWKKKTHLLQETHFRAKDT